MQPFPQGFSSAAFPGIINTSYYVIAWRELFILTQLSKQKSFICHSKQIVICRTTINWATLKPLTQLTGISCFRNGFKHYLMQSILKTLRSNHIFVLPIRISIPFLVISFHSSRITNAFFLLFCYFWCFRLPSF